MRQSVELLGEEEEKHGGREGLFLLGKKFSKELQAYNSLCQAERRKGRKGRSYVIIWHIKV